MLNRTFFVSIAVCVAASYGAYAEHRASNPAARASEERVIHENIARSVAADAIERQHACLANDPTDWCNRDLSYRDHLRSARSLAAEHGRVYNMATGAKGTGLFVLIAAIAGWIAIVQLRGPPKESPPRE
jgi:hypothetical protein